MKEKTELIVRVPSHYVGEDCIQTIINYKDSMIMLSPSGILYHDQVGQDSVHEYLNDERRKQFPYSNIPAHTGTILLKKWRFVNQLLDFDKPYLRIDSLGLTENFAIKDGEEALLVNRICLPDEEQAKYLSRHEVEKLFDKSTTGDKQKLIVYKGELTDGLYMPSEDELVQRFKDYAKRSFVDMAESTEHSFATTYGPFEKLINRASVEDIPENFFIADNIIVVNSADDDMTIQRVSIKFMNSDLYKVGVSHVPINRYTLEQLKGAAEIYDAREPIIRPKLNSNIDVAEIESAKRLVMERNQKNVI